jgi:hypothetical protein
MSLSSDNIRDDVSVTITANDNDKRRRSEKKGSYVKNKHVLSCTYAEGGDCVMLV